MPADSTTPRPAGDDLPRPQHVKLVKGRWYWDPPDRLRKSHNLKTHSLGADQSAAWAYARTLNRDHLGLGEKDAPIGTVAWLLEAFLASEKAQRLAATTLKDYKWLARKVLITLPLRDGMQLGRFKALAVRPRHADAFYEQLVRDRGHATAHYACRFARRVWKWGARNEMVDPQNPWSGMELPGLKPRTALWTADQVAAVVAKAEEAGRPSLGLATLIGYWLGHRQADVLALTWSALAITRVDTEKTGANLPVNIDAYPELKAALSAASGAQAAAAKAAKPRRVRPAHVVIHESTNERYNATTFRHEWRDIATKAGIPTSLQFRDLRATALTELNDAGADVIAMSTHSGHRTMQMARRYARPTTTQFTNAAKLRTTARAAKKKEPGK